MSDFLKYMITGKRPRKRKSKPLMQDQRGYQAYKLKSALSKGVPWYKRI